MPQITINGKEMTVKSDTLSYDEIVRLAGKKRGSMVFFSKPEGSSLRRGELDPRGSVNDVDGMSFTLHMMGPTRCS